MKNYHEARWQLVGNVGALKGYMQGRGLDNLPRFESLVAQLVLSMAELLLSQKPPEGEK